MIGWKIGSYEIVEQIGQGTSTATWLARDDRGKLAVVKRLLDALAADEQAVERFLAAVDLSGKIRMRKHVAAVLAQKRSSDGVFLMRQYVEGESLARFAEQGRLAALDRDQRDQIARDLCDAVRAMASRDVVHGGLHPGNAIVQPDGRIKITDFGIGATVLTGAVPRSCPLDALRYLAPEQWRGQPASTRTDIYGVAALIRLTDCGRAVFPAGDQKQLEQQILAGCNDLCPVLAAGLDPDPARRYPSIDPLRARLSDRKLLPPTPTPPPPSPTASAGSSLDSIFDVKQRQNLLENLPPKPWMVARDGRRQQRPLQVANGGPGDLQLSVSCAGAGVSASPPCVMVSPGQMAAVIVRVEPDSARFANLIFRWTERGEEKSLVVKIVRPE